MNKQNEIDNKIKQAFTNATPDILSSVLSDCAEQKGNVIIMKEKKKINPWAMRIAGIAAAFVLIFGGIIGFQNYKGAHDVAATVALDVNPSIEIQVNQREKVLTVDPLNEEGRIVVGSMDFSGNDLDVTVNALIGSMLRNGYLNELANSILISVDSDDPAKGAELSARLKDEVNTLLKTDTFMGAVLSQTISPDKELQDLADKYGITEGKAQLIKQIRKNNRQHNFEDLACLSINELNVLRQSHGGNLDNVSAIGNASEKAYIGQEKAKEIALKYAGVTDRDIKKFEIETDYEKGVFVYEIEFCVGNMGYEFDINALSGEIVSFEKELDDDCSKYHIQTQERTQTNEASVKGQSHSNGSHNSEQNRDNSSKNYIGEAKAKEIALNHAGVAAEDISRYEIEMEHDKGVMVYDIEFYVGNAEYEYDIDAVTGKIVSFEKEI